MMTDKVIGWIPTVGGLTYCIRVAKRIVCFAAVVWARHPTRFLAQMTAAKETTKRIDGVVMITGARPKEARRFIAVMKLKA